MPKDKFADDEKGKADIGLAGCTVIVAISAKGIWISHIWEVPGYSKGKGFPTDKFNDEVIAFIQNGVATASEADKKKDPLPKAVKISDHKTDLTKAEFFIVSPSKGKNSNNFLYPSKVEQTKEKMEEVLDMKGKINWNNFYYHPAEGDVYPVLFEYDPNGKGKGEKQARLMLAGFKGVFDGKPGSLKHSGGSID
jgi:hypothetical protein